MPVAKPFIVAVCTALVLGFACAAHAQIQLDHFKAYAVNEQRVNHHVRLQGQFDEQPRAAMLSAIVRFANPVDKNSEAIRNRHAHLTWYRMHGPAEPKRKVISLNQFGEQPLLLGQPKVFLAPTQKHEAGSEFPSSLDHFKCYEVLEGDAVNRSVELTDQFLKTKMIAERPQFFCVPVRKIHSQQNFEPQNRTDHLTIYNLTRQIKTSNQFTPPSIRELAIKEDTMLLVPGQKKRPPHGTGLDHFRFYVVSELSIQATPTVMGQFDNNQARTIPLGKLTHFATPVDKNGEGILNRHAHLSLYRLLTPQTEPIRRVKLNNQFGEQTIRIQEAVALLAPAEKIEEGSRLPEGLDHFMCYRVIDGVSLNKPVTLLDQFPPQQQAQVEQPILFCVPVTKRHNDQVFERQNEEARLTIYQTTPTPSVSVTRGFQDQFFPNREIEIQRGVWLGVPTDKIDAVVTP